MTKKGKENLDLLSIQQNTKSFSPHCGVVTSRLSCCMWLCQFSTHNFLFSTAGVAYTGTVHSTKEEEKLLFFTRYVDPTSICVRRERRRRRKSFRLPILRRGSKGPHVTAGELTRALLLPPNITSHHRRSSLCKHTPGWNGDPAQYCRVTV